MIQGLNHVALRTKRLEESIQFYVSILGFRQVSRPPFDFRGAWLYAGRMQIHLIESQDAGNPGEIDTRTNHFAFAVENVERVAARLDTFQIPYVRRRMPEWGNPQIYVQDPDGNVIEMGEYREPTY